MLILKRVGPSVASYYLRQGPGSWLGDGAHRLGLDDSVQRADLTAVLRGCDPSTGAYLPPVRSERRRAGWDLVFAAPKSLSLFAATSPDAEAASVRSAQNDSARAAVEHLERDVGKGIVAAAFDHAANAGSEPHLHTHVLVANLTNGADGWKALGRWLNREELAAVYHLGLRYHLELGGVNLPWRIRSDGMPDLAAVPRAAIRAASTRSHESRTGRVYLGRSGGARDWRATTTAAGWSEANASGALVEKANHPREPVGDGGSRELLEARVASQLLTVGSTFSSRDVTVALAGCASRGFDAEAAASWTKSFCQSAIPIAADVEVKRWTTPLAQGADRRLVEALERRDPVQVRDVSDLSSLSPVEGEFALSGPSAHTVRSMIADGALVVLSSEYGRSNFVADATTLGACASAWEKSGLTVALATRAPRDYDRWAALTGIEPFHPSKRPDVLLVDQAERRPPGELMTIAAAAPNSRIVFIEGGTLPRARIDSSFGYSRVAASAVRVDPGPAPAWDPIPDTLSSLAPQRSAAIAAGQLLGRWADAVSDAQGPRPFLVGLGVPEVVALNEAGRRHLAGVGEIGGPSLKAWGRSFQAGDRVLAFGNGGEGIRSGMAGTVWSVDSRRKAAIIEWPVGRVEMKPAMLGRVGHAYATTPRLAARMNGPMFVLGRSEGLGLDRARVAAAVSVERQGPARARDRDAPVRGLV